MPKASFILQSQEIDLNAVTKTEEGFLVLNAFPARDGDYEYFAFEYMDMFPDHQPLETIIGRIENEDLEKALDSFKGAIITNDHPFPFVEFSNVKELQVGHMGDAVSIDKGLVKQKAYITDSSMIADIVNGKQELSIGAQVSIKKPESKKDGDPDFYITDMKINHVAIVEKGRAGEKARLTHSTRKDGGALLVEKSSIRNEGKNQQTNTGEFMPKIVINSVSFEVDQKVADSIAAERLAKETELSNAQKSAKDAQEALSKVEAERDDLKVENEKLEGAASPESIANAVKDETAFAEKMKAVNSNYVHEVGANRTEVMRNHLQEVNPDFDYTDKEAAYIDAAFDIVANKKSGAGAMDTEINNSAEIDDVNEKLKLAHAKRNAKHAKKLNGGS